MASLFYLVVLIGLVLFTQEYLTNHLGISKEELSKLWGGFFIFSCVKDVAMLIVAIFTAGLASILTYAVGAAVSGLFAYLFLKRSGLLK